MGNKIILTESELYAIIREAVMEISKKASKFDNLLAGAEDIDKRSATIYARQLLSDDFRISRDSPYKAVKTLVNFFKHYLIANARSMSSQVILSIMKHEGLTSAVNELIKKDAELYSYVYDKSKMLTGNDLLQRIAWELDSMIDIILRLEKAYDETNARNWYSHIDIIGGNVEKKIVGLNKLLSNAVNATKYLRQQISYINNIFDINRRPENNMRFRRY